MEQQCCKDIYYSLPVQIYVPDFNLDIFTSSEPSFSPPSTLRGWFIQQNTLRRNWSRRWSCPRPLEETWYLTRFTLQKNNRSSNDSFSITSTISYYEHSCSFEPALVLEYAEIFPATNVMIFIVNAVVGVMTASVLEQGHHALWAGDSRTLSRCGHCCYSVLPAETRVPNSALLLILPTWGSSQVSWLRAPFKFRPL